VSKKRDLQAKRLWKKRVNATARERSDSMIPLRLFRKTKDPVTFYDASTTRTSMNYGD
jgi:hypothetical protein